MQQKTNFGPIRNKRFPQSEYTLHLMNFEVFYIEIKYTKIQTNIFRGDEIKIETFQVSLTSFTYR